jgi:hypothetical protein
MADALSASFTSVTMHHTASRSFVAEWHIVTCHVFEVLWVWSVAKADYRHCQGHGPRLANASCWRRCNHQRGHAGSAVVPWCQPSITTYASSTVCLASHAVKAYRHDLTPSLQCQLLRKDGSQSAVALGVGLGSLTHRAGIPVHSLLVIYSYGKVT